MPCAGVEVKVIRQSNRLHVEKKHRTVLADKEIIPNKEAMDSLYHRFGNEDYDALKKDILRTLPDMKYPGAIVASVRIFYEAQDVTALTELFDSLDNTQIPDDDSWHQIGRILDSNSLKRESKDLVSESYLLKCPISNIMSHWDNYFSNEYIKHLEDGTASARQRTAIRKLMESSPYDYANLVQYFPEEQPSYVKLNAVLEKNKDGKERRQAIERMRCLVSKVNSKKLTSEQIFEFRKFIQLLNKEKPEELMEFISFCKSLNWFKEAIPYLEKWQDKDFSAYELDYAQLNCSAMLTPEMAKEIMTEYRRNTLISFLLQSGMVSEAQKIAEKFYGKEVDINSIDRMDIHLLGAVQGGSGQHFFETKLNQREIPKKDGIDFFREKVQYYMGRKEPQNILKVYEEAIEHGKKTNALELIVWGMKERVGHIWDTPPADRQKALELSRQAWEFAAEHITLEASKHNPDLGILRNQVSDEYMLWCIEHHLAEEMDKVFRREMRDGFYSCGDRYVMNRLRKDKTFTLSADDSAFENINNPSYQKRYGYQQKLHIIRLMAVPLKTTKGMDFQACLEQAVSDFKQAMVDHPNHYSSGAWLQFLSTIHFFHNQDADIREALVSKCLYDEFHQNCDEFHRNFLLVKSISARSYDEGKRLLESAWKCHSLSAHERIQGLRNLMKTASSADERQWCTEQLKLYSIQP